MIALQIVIKCSIFKSRHCFLYNSFKLKSKKTHASIALKQYAAETIGTFALVFCGTAAIIVNDLSGGLVSHVGVSLSFGTVVMIMIYAFGPLSGAHINPAVSIAFSLTDRFQARQLIPYLLAQLCGAFLASILLKYLFLDPVNLGATLPSGSWQQSFVLETILSYLLMLVILMVGQNQAIQAFTGLAVGSTVLLEALFAGPISGASMNPARSIAPAVVSGQIGYLWLYIVAPVLGAVLASLSWKWFEAP